MSFKYSAHLSTFKKLKWISFSILINLTATKFAAANQAIQIWRFFLFILKHRQQSLNQMKIVSIDQLSKEYINQSAPKEHIKSKGAVHQKCQ